MNLGTLFFTKYKTFNSLLKFILSWLLIVALVLWLIGNLTKVDCLVTSIFMSVVCFILFYIFNTEIISFMDIFILKLNEIIDVLN